MLLLVGYVYKYQRPQKKKLELICKYLPNVYVISLQPQDRFHTDCSDLLPLIFLDQNAKKLKKRRGGGVPSLVGIFQSIGVVGI